MSSDSLASFKELMSNFSLPIFMTKKNRRKVGFFLAGCAGLLYMPSNHFHLFTPRLLSFSWVDYVVPFMPHTVWIYVSEYIFFIAVWSSAKDIVGLNKYFYSFLSLWIVSVAIFFLWPTTYPRQMFPLPADLDAVTFFVFDSLRATDTPANCCPSLHVSSVYLSSFIFLDERREKFSFFFVWATAIALSTLTTKQHYMIDVVSGLSMAIAFYCFFHRYIQYRPWKKR